MVYWLTQLHRVTLPQNSMALLENQEFSDWVISKHHLDGGGVRMNLEEAVFLMSEAGSFVNGQILSIDGGMSIQV